MRPVKPNSQLSVVALSPEPPSPELTKSSSSTISSGILGIVLSVVLMFMPCIADDVTFEVNVVVSTPTVWVELFVGTEYVVEAEVTTEVLVASKIICVVFDILEVTTVLDGVEFAEVTNLVVVVLMTSVKLDLDGAKVSGSLVVAIEPLSMTVVVGMMVVSRDCSLVVTSKVVNLVVSATTVDW